MFNIEKAYGSVARDAIDKGFISPAVITSPAINPLAEMVKRLESEAVKDVEKKVSPVKITIPDEIKRMIMESSTKIERVIFNNPVTVVLWAESKIGRASCRARV
mgnify:CR=1 FL=1